MARKMSKWTPGSAALAQEWAERAGKAPAAARESRCIFGCRFGYRVRPREHECSQLKKTEKKQLGERLFDSGTRGRRFESAQACHIFNSLDTRCFPLRPSLWGLLWGPQLWFIETKYLVSVVPL